MEFIKSTTLAEAWLAACQHLDALPGRQDFTLLLHVAEPLRVRAPDRLVARLLNAFLMEHGAFGNHTVAETIFPGYEYMHRGAAGVYAYPDTVYPLIEHHPDRRPWGVYAHRILRRTKADGTVYSPLAKCIEKLRDSKPKKAAYELGLGFDKIVDDDDLSTPEIPIHDDDIDSGYRMQGPCLSHLSFKRMPGKRLQLTAIYRNHYYVQRAYGNLLGLARMQDFVAREAGYKVGPLVCHSTMANLESDRRWKLDDLHALIARCRAAYVGSGDSVSSVESGHA